MYPLLDTSSTNLLLKRGDMTVIGVLDFSAIFLMTRALLPAFFEAGAGAATSTIDARFFVLNGDSSTGGVDWPGEDFRARVATGFSGDATTVSVLLRNSLQGYMYSSAGGNL